MKIFIADDSSLIRERLKEMINTIKNAVFIGEAANTADALREICSLAPDVVILDIRMPDGNGFDIIPPIKKLHPSTTVIMFTNFPLPQYKQKCKAMGAEYFYDKAGEFDALAHTLTALADKESAVQPSLKRNA